MIHGVRLAFKHGDIRFSGHYASSSRTTCDCGLRLLGLLSVPGLKECV
ncbi:hypothetical protein JI435_413800 [Parastagonospora nodorum SN15]|uniref:Uncharacterized protein n=1 Tax=Phaeosphaeria nodorum (strain SN15 / ATCC MYA-4574 / FGSC 10173) TaxID=321614 RepID=A0A7U2I516_PHANO|nr:hypothetical protein JI435_413800 [Parastagonospora nodorum SN15]